MYTAEAIEGISHMCCINSRKYFMKEMMNGLIRKFDIEIYEFDKQIQHEWRGSYMYSNCEFDYMCVAYVIPMSLIIYNLHSTYNVHNCQIFRT